MMLKEDNPLGRPAEDALIGLVRLLKAVAYYPAGHPSLQAAVDEARKGFAPALSGEEPLTVTVRRDGFSLAELPLSPHPLLKRLAAHLFARRVQTLTFLPELSGRDLLAFCRALGREPADLQRQGGIAEVLRGARVGTVWANETDLSRILARRAEMEETAEEEELPGGEDRETEPPPPAPSAAGDDLPELLEKLRREESDMRYREILRELVSVLRLRLRGEQRYAVLDALAFLLERSESDGSPARREASSQALRQLAAGEVVGFLLLFLYGPGIEDALQEKVLHLLLFYREEAARPLMARLTEEADLRARRMLMEVLVLLGEAALPVLREHLQDGRWYVVRNAAAMLGEIRRPETVADLRSLLDHPDLRVRREAVRALTRIGGPDAVGILLGTVERGDPELTRQALLSLGALRDREAVPTLLRLAGRPDPLVRRAEIRKGAIRALGEIGAPEAVPVLVRVLRRRIPWRRAQADEVRAAAAAALGEIAGGGASALEKALEDRSPQVARAAAQALKQIGKGQHGSGTQ